MFHKQTYAEMLTSLEELRIWMKSNKINFDPSRYGAFKKILEDLEYHRTNNSLDEYMKAYGFKETLFSFFEADELLFIFEYFRQDCPEFIRNKLSEAMQGPIGIDEEKAVNASNHPRNILFELKVQAVIRAAGLHEGSSGDASCAIDGSALIFECKRPQNYGSIKKNVSRARKQLRKDLGSLNNIKSKGIIALSIGKILHEGLKYLSVPSSEHLEPMLSQKIKEVVEKLRLVKEVTRDNKILGLLCDLSSPVVIDNEKLIVAANQFAFFKTNELPMTNKFANAIDKYFHPN